MKIFLKKLFYERVTLRVDFKEEKKRKKFLVNFFRYTVFENVKKIEDSQT